MAKEMVEEDGKYYTSEKLDSAVGSFMGIVPFCQSCAVEWMEVKDEIDSPGLVGLFGSTTTGIEQLSAQVSDMASELAALKDSVASKSCNPIPASDRAIDSLVKEVVTQTVSRSGRAFEDANNRLRSVVIDGLPENPARPDSSLVEELLAHLGPGAYKALEVHRMGPVKPDDPRPRKVKVLLASVAQQAALLSKETRNCLRNSPMSKQRWPNVFVSPLRTAAERDKLFLLRRRRDILNDCLTDRNRANCWYVDSVRYTLGKLSNGTVDRGALDEGLHQWMAVQLLKLHTSAAA